MVLVASVIYAKGVEGDRRNLEKWSAQKEYDHCLKTNFIF